jgi:hypothetical protein
MYVCKSEQMVDEIWKNVEMEGDVDGEWWRDILSIFLECGWRSRSMEAERAMIDLLVGACSSWASLFCLQVAILIRTVC